MLGRLTRDDWGKRNGFYEKRGTYGRVVGSHNCFAQITLYWGIAGFLALLIIIWQAYRCLPYGLGKDPLYLGLLGLSVAAILESQVMHLLYAKAFSLALGLLVAGAQWIWPRGRIQTVSRNLTMPLGEISQKSGLHP